MSEPVTLAVDACGGDFAPQNVVDGVAAALSDDPDLNILLCGPASVVEPFSATHARLSAVCAEEVIGMGEHPAEAVRAKRDSSIVVGCQLVRDGAADGFFSAGSTGACLVAATLEIGRIKGVKRPALAIMVPAYERPVLLLDVGANADCKLDYLVQFAHMGAAYMSAVMGLAAPRVGLLNIGEEETKGSQFTQSAYRLLCEEVPAFAGNCEGGGLMRGDFDVVVTDGFTGNVALKTIEGTAKAVSRLLKDSLMSSPKGKVGALFAKGSLAGLKERISPDTYGGSPLLGVKGVCIVGHGASSAQAIKNGILTGAREVRGHLVEVIAATVGTPAKAPASESNNERDGAQASAHERGVEREGGGHGTE